MTNEQLKEEQIVLVKHDAQGVCRITMNNPARRNALSNQMLSLLLEAFIQAQENSEVRVIVLCANGAVFCSGHDLKELARAGDDENRRDFYRQIMSLCSRLMQYIVNCSKPVIAEVRGVATAAGCQLVASCDLAYADELSKFATPGVNIGLFCSTPMVALSRNVCNKHAMQMLLTGEMISANEAVAIGLINATASAAVLNDKTMQIATSIAQKSAKTLAIGKEAFYQQVSMSLEDAYDYAAKVMVDNMLMEDAQEGINAFLEKREAHWSDR